MTDSPLPSPWLLSATELIAQATASPPQAVVEGLLAEGDILLVHAPEESYKSVFIAQLAEAVAAGTPLMGRWQVPTSLKTAILETEIHQTQMGARCRMMFGQAAPPKALLFWSKAAVSALRRKAALNAKLAFLSEVVCTTGIEALFIDTANDFFRGTDDPSAEGDVGAFFDALRNLPLKLCGIVRHDRKRAHERADDSTEALHSNESIRGSAHWKENPETIFALDRANRRSHKVTLEVGKLRYGVKPDNVTLWFDAGTFRLTGLPPVIALLEGHQVGMKRASLLDALGTRFGAKTTRALELVTAVEPWLEEGNDGHARIFRVAWERLRAAEVEQVPWKAFVAGL